MRENARANQKLDNIKQNPQAICPFKEQETADKSCPSKNRKCLSATIGDCRRPKRSENSRVASAEKQSQQAARGSKQPAHRNSSSGASKSSRKANSKLKQVAIDDIITRVCLHKQFGIK